MTGSGLFLIGSRNLCLSIYFNCEGVVIWPESFAKLYRRNYRKFFAEKFRDYIFIGVNGVLNHFPDRINISPDRLDFSAVLASESPSDRISSKE